MCTRRRFLASTAAAAATGLASAPPLRAAAPSAPVSIARCASYNDDVGAILRTMFDQLGGAAKLVNNKTVTIKLNLTGSPALKFQGRALGLTHYTHPRTVGALLDILGKAGARRIRLVESGYGTAMPLEEYLLDSGWNVRALQNAAPKVEFENTNALGVSKKYATVRVPTGGTIYPAYVLNSSYVDTDFFVSMAKLKNHAVCGVTLAMKNIFGITPASIYGDDAGVDEPNEQPTKGRVRTCHDGARQPAKMAPAERDPSTPRLPGYRMPRITADLVKARPIDLAFVDGVETVTGGEGPWIRGLQHVKPGVLFLGTNSVCTDAVATAAMGYDPRAPRGTAPFRECDNTLLLAEALGAGSADLKQIEVRGLSLNDARFAFPR